MLAKERQNIIKKLLEQNGAVKTTTIVEKFNVSVEIENNINIYNGEK